MFSCHDGWNRLHLHGCRNDTFQHFEIFDDLRWKRIERCDRKWYFISFDCNAIFRSDTLSAYLLTRVQALRCEAIATDISTFQTANVVVCPIANVLTVPTAYLE